MRSVSKLSRTVLFQALRFAFRLAPMPQNTRDRLRQKFLDRYWALVPSGPTGISSRGRQTRRPYRSADEEFIHHVAYAKGELPDPLPATLVAFYLPQFHPIPENDRWWGKGFTEWRNVTRALPQFEGHVQPLLPGDLGFYDLRGADVMREQARLAREYGIEAFCFYFYWFGGKTLLETPLQNWLDDPSIDRKFCLCWANEKWTRAWDGRGGEVLIDQDHSPEDDIAFIEHIAAYLRDPRYLRVEDKPVLLVYRPNLFPDIKASSERWRQWCRENGIGEIHLAYVQSFEQPIPQQIGFDAAVEFPPNLTTQPPITQDVQLINDAYTGSVFDWREMARQFQCREVAGYPLHRGVNVGWDNEARRPGAGRTYRYSSHRGYRDWLTASIASSRSCQGERPLVFINAWNEWAEGAALEPSLQSGYAMLQATRDALTVSTPTPTAPASARKPPVIVHAWYLEEFEEILSLITTQKFYSRLIVTTCVEKKHPVERMLSRHGVPYELHAFENRGRDVLPFLRIANMLADSGEDLVLKLHTKRSVHIANGAEWRQELVSGVAEPDVVDRIISSFEVDAKLGMVTADDHRQPIAGFMGANRPSLLYLSSLLGVPLSDMPETCFPSGNMFWVRLAALRPVLDGMLKVSDFEPENSQTDGTTAHALERMFGASVAFTGFEFRTASELGFGGARRRATPEPYRYAARRTQGGDGP
jgi:lipopolysaccharide biosynthesis protein